MRISPEYTPTSTDEILPSSDTNPLITEAQWIIDSHLAACAKSKQLLRPDNDHTPSDPRTEAILSPDVARQVRVLSSLIAHQPPNIEAIGAAIGVYDKSFRDSFRKIMRGLTAEIV